MKSQRMVRSGNHTGNDARERLLASIAARLPETDPASLAIGNRDGIPSVLRRGRWEDWSISLSHSGRLAAWAWIGPQEDPQ